MAKSQRGLKIAGLSLAMILVASFTCLLAVICGIFAIPKLFPQQFDEASTQVALKDTERTKAQPSTTGTPSPTMTASANRASPSRTPPYTATPSPSFTPTSIPTSTSTRITPTTQPTQTHTVAPTQYIAGLLGLNPADITINLEDRGFECTNAQTITGGYVWTCEEDMISYLMRVDIYSFSTIVSVDYIDAGIGFFEEPNNDLAISFLGFIATAPYDNAEPIAAREWVETTLPTITSPGDIREAEFGGVKFQLFGPPTSRYLEFGDLGEDY